MRTTIIHRTRSAMLGLFAAGAVLIASTACGQTSTTPGDYWIDTVEATQGVQSLNLVPLLANKMTYVRVTIRGNPNSSGVLPTVRPSLSIDGVSYQPINSPTLVAARSTGSAAVQALTRWSLDDSFLYRLEAPQTTTGDHAVHVTLEATDGFVPPPPSPPARADKSRDVSLHFNEPLSLRFYGVTYGYYNVPPELQAAQHLTSSTWPARDRSAFDRLIPLALNVLPLSSLSVDTLPNNPIGSFDCRYRPGANGAVGGCDGYADSRTWAQDLIDAAVPNGGAWIVILQAEVDGPGGHHGAYFGTPHGNHVINLQEDTTDTGAVLAHEIGHGMGLCHPQESAPTATPTLSPGLATPTTPAAVYCDYPRGQSAALGDYIGVRSVPTLHIVRGVDDSGGIAARDVMNYNYSPDWWISPHNYCVALKTYTNHRLTCQAHLDHS